MYRADCVIIDSIDRALVTVAGEDAADFLHAMCTNDIKNLSENRLLPAAFCQPNGQVICSFVVWHDTQAYHMLVPLAMAEKVYQWLTKHRLRSRVTIDIAEGKRFIGLIGKETNLILGNTLPEPMTVLSNTEDQGYILNLGERFLIVAESTKVACYQYEAQQKEAITLPSYYWRWLDVMMGWLNITEETTNRYVPQEINLDLMGVIDFKKGCYPGQEVVTRVQNLVKKKKRMLLYESKEPTSLPTGAPVYFEKNVVGEVITAQLSPKNTYHLLVLVSTEGVDLADLSTELGKLGPCLELPYPVDQLEAVKTA